MNNNLKTSIDSFIDYKTNTGIRCGNYSIDTSIN